MADRSSGLKKTRDVGSYRSNPWVYLICMEMFGSGFLIGKRTILKVMTDPEGPASGSNRVRRGGSENPDGANLRSTVSRYSSNPPSPFQQYRFRVTFQKASKKRAPDGATALDWV